MLREARGASGLTQIALAESLGWAQSDVSKVERGVRRLDVVELRSWLLGLGLSLERFAAELDRRLTTAQELHAHFSPSRANRQALRNAK